MSATFAHSERQVKTGVRNSRLASAPAPSYRLSMRLKIKQMRIDRGWTLDDMQEKTGVSRSYISEIENGKKTVNGKRLDSFAKAFGCSPIDLIDDQSVGDDIMEHLRRLRRLSDTDRGAVLRHAIVLDPGEEQDGD